MNRDAIIQK